MLFNNAKSMYSGDSDMNINIYV